MIGLIRSLGGSHLTKLITGARLDKWIWGSKKRRRQHNTDEDRAGAKTWLL